MTINKPFGVCKVLLAVAIATFTSSCGHHQAVITTRSASDEFLFVAGDGQVLSLRIDTATGMLSNLQQASGPSSPSGVGLNSTGVYLYLLGSSSVNAFAVDISGKLIAIDGSPFSVGANTVSASLAVDPKANLLYVTDFAIVTTPPATVGGISGFTIDGSTGKLGSVDNSPFGAPQQETFITIDPSGRFLYSANTGSSSNLSGFSINLNSGQLTRIPGSPWTVPSLAAPTVPGMLAVDSTGKFLYVGLVGEPGLVGYNISSVDGSLTVIPGSPFPAGSGVSFISVSAGNFVYAIDPSLNTVSAFSVNASTGAITPIAGSPFSAGTATGGLAVDRSGRFLFVADHKKGSILAFRIDPASGALTLLGSTPVSISGTDALFLASY